MTTQAAEITMALVRLPLHSNTTVMMAAAMVTAGKEEGFGSVIVMAAAAQQPEWTAAAAAAAAAAQETPAAVGFWKREPTGLLVENLKVAVVMMEPEAHTYCAGEVRCRTPWL